MNSVSDFSSSVRADRLFGLVVAPLLWLARLPRAIVMPLLAVIAATPFVLRRTAEFKSDDILLIAQGVEQGVFGGLVRNFARPFCDTWVIEFYRPLFTWSFCLDGHLFGGDPTAYYAVNIGWHVLAVLAAYAFLRRLVGAEAAFLATLLFAANPWACNNVAWLAGRCTTVASVLVWLGAALYLDHRDRGRTKVPWHVVFIATIAIFYRETCLYLPVLCFLSDVFRKRLDFRAIRNGFMLSLPFVVYMLAKIAALGTWLGGYVRLDSLRSERLVEQTPFALATEIGTAWLELLVPGSGEGLPGEAPPWDAIRWATLGVFVLLIGLGLFGRGWRRATFWLFVTFVVVHAAPLLAVDRAVHGGTAQRWSTIMWGVAAALAVAARYSRMPRLAATLILLLAAAGFYRLDANLAQYDRASSLSREIRRQITACETDIVCVYNLKIYDGASAFYAVGMGQTQLPPFVPAGKGKRVYPIFAHHRWGQAIETQVPVAPMLAARGESVATLFVDYDNHQVLRVDPMLVYQVTKLRDLPRLEVDVPSAPFTDDVEQLTISCRADGLERIDIHTVVPLTHDWRVRTRRAPYSRGEFTADGRYVEDITPLLEYATLLPGPSDGRTFIWLVGWKNVDDFANGRSPAAVSEVFEVRSTVPQVSPH